MIAEWVVIVSGLGYLGLLFAIAYRVERGARRGNSWVNNPYVYALSLAVYCTAWTYYGSVGRASTAGLEFVTIYLGPTLMAPLSWVILRKIIRICRVHRISTLPDFLSARYGKSITLGGVVTLLCVMAVIPYVSLQLKAISNSYELLVEGQARLSAASAAAASTIRGPFWEDSAFSIAVLLAVFTMLYGTRHIDATVRREGMVMAIAFESLFKLVAFLAVGVYVTWGLFGGFGEIFERAAAQTDMQRLFTLDADSSNWAYMLGLSMLAIVLLPRQFQVSVLENVDERHLNKAMWLFPLYLLVINIFVLPIAFGGRLLLGAGADPDMFVLSLPLAHGQYLLALLVYLGGFAAATSMIIISTISLSIMLSNNLMMPLLVSIPQLKQPLAHRLSRILVLGRRVNIALVLLLAFAYYYLVAERFSLVSIGLISFAGVAQFAPAMFGGLYWKSGNKPAALASIAVGFSVWFFTLVVPTIVAAGLLPESIMTDGLFGAALLRPYALLGMTGLEPLSHGAFWSLFLNALVYVGVSFATRQSSAEIYQAALFVDVFQHSDAAAQADVWKGTAYKEDLQSLLVRFLGAERTERALRDYLRRHQLEQDQNPQADRLFVSYVERLLRGVIGAASARILVSSIVKEEEITLDDVLHILRESQQLIAVNRQLVETSRDLKRATDELQAANQRLQTIDGLKDEFISTVTHEMRTPITSIRAMAEILYDHPDLPAGQRKEFLHTIVKESERMNRLINQVLDLERFESGVQKLQLGRVQLAVAVAEAVDSVAQLAREQHVALDTDLPADLPEIAADYDRIVQVLLNLLSNAIKFCEPGQGRIVVAATVAGAELHLSVCDNGRGIDPDSLPHIFDKFFQATNQGLRKPKGTGLGLAIVKKIVELHQGRIWAENCAGGGTRFTFALPLKPQLAPAPHVTEQQQTRHDR